MPTIRIDDDVYSWLKSQAIPFEDTPNSVLRRLAGSDKSNDMNAEVKKEDKGEEQMITANRPRGKRWSGKLLQDLWQIDGAKHVLYHKDGTFFENLRNFPGALCDDNGYIIFKNEQDYDNCSYLDIGQKLNVHRGISSIPGYKRMR